MGNTLSPILADIYMDEYQKQYLTKINIPDKFYRYVDDILIITKMNQQELDNYISELNKVHKTIKFTHEYEQNNQLNYLDTTLTKINSNNTAKLKIRWHRKDTATDRLLKDPAG